MYRVWRRTIRRGIGDTNLALGGVPPASGICA
jgi:hypothetical protein